MQNNLFQLNGVDLVVPVKGIEGAKSYPMGPNCRVPLFDSEEDVLYIKSTDPNCFPSIKVYDFSERVVIDENSPAAISLNDIRALIREELGNVKEDIINAQQPVPANNYSTNAQNVNTNAPTYKHDKSRPKYTKQQSGADTSSVEFGKEQPKSTGSINASNE